MDTIGFSFFDNYLPSGWRIVSQNNRQVVIDNQGAGIGNFAIIPVGAAINFAYIHVNDNIVGTHPVAGTVTPGSGGENEFSNNFQSQNINTTAVSWVVQSLDGTEEEDCIYNDITDTSNTTNITAPYTRTASAGVETFDFFVKTIGAGDLDEYVLTSVSVVGLVAGISIVNPFALVSRNLEGSIEVDFNTLASGTYIIVVDAFVTRTIGGSETGQITIPLQIVKP